VQPPLCQHHPVCRLPARSGRNSFSAPKPGGVSTQPPLAALYPTPTARSAPVSRPQPAETFPFPRLRL